MRPKTKQRAEYGDFQTPSALAAVVCRLLDEQHLRPASLIEPTCGLGSFVFAGLDRFQEIKKAVGIDVSSEYICRANEVLQGRVDAAKVTLDVGNFFAINWRKLIGELPEPALVIGNLPWVTNAHLESLGSNNLPHKTNFQGHSGLDALTGKANFDISEWMLIRLLEAMNGRQGTLAMLCKSAVARKALYHAWKHEIRLGNSAIYGIDAGLHFDAAVDAALLVTHLGIESGPKEAKVCSSLTTVGRHTTIGYEDGALYADIDAYRRWKHLRGREVIRWRSGIKHDCAKVMEFRREGQRYLNGFGQSVDVEDDYVYPMLKSSGVANGCADDDLRYMLVTQRTVGEDTAGIETNAPNTWDYLNRHADLLSRRGSTIYRNRPPFSIFGVGDYSFAPWKVAISGFYKRLAFFVVGPFEKKPVVLDDTSYFLPCDTEAQARYLAKLLNSDAAKAFYRAFVFWDAKRPITADLLRRLDLRSLARELGSETQFDRHFQVRDRDPALTTLEFWP